MVIDQKEEDPKGMGIDPLEAIDHRALEELRGDNNGQVEETGHQINP